MFWEDLYRSAQEDTLNWARIPEFENYEVSRGGDVRNVRRKTLLKPSTFGSETVSVQLSKYGVTFTRSLAKLVADAWVDDKPYPSCDTPIHLDGDRWNCHADNLRMRPLWYAREFNKERKQPTYPIWDKPFYCLETSETFLTLHDCGGVHGLLEDDIFDALRTGGKAYLIDYHYAYC